MVLGRGGAAGHGVDVGVAAALVDRLLLLREQREHLLHFFRLGGGADQGDGGTVQVLACRCTVDTKPGADQRFIDRITHMGQGDGAHFTQLIRG